MVFRYLYLNEQNILLFLEKHSFFLNLILLKVKIAMKGQFFKREGIFFFKISSYNIMLQLKNSLVALNFQINRNMHV
jgi:hypothetical protein